MNTARLVYQLMRISRTHGTEKTVSLFLKLIEQYGLQAIVPDVLTSLQRLSASKSYRDVHITTDRQLPRDILMAISEHHGEHILPEERVDETLVGGYIFETKEYRFDASIKTQLAHLHHNLIHSL